jgi:multiple sugar transport system ATP-binding protein
MTVADNITFGLRRQGLPESQIGPKLAHVSGLLGLGDLLERKPKQLSGGQQQRVAMARAIIKTPRVFLFDEPLSNLDAKLREKLRTEIRKIHLDLKTTTIFVTHDQLEAMTIADRIVLMRAGKIEQMGTPDDIFESPNSRFVADFIGTPAMNFVPGTIRQGPKGPRVEAAGQVLELPANAFDGLSPDRPVELGLRPSRMDLCSPEDENAFQGRVVLIENMGSDGQVISAVDGMELSFVTKEFRSLTPGDSVHFSIKPNHIHLFDAETGASLRRQTASQHRERISA